MFHLILLTRLNLSPNFALIAPMADSTPAATSGPRIQSHPTILSGKPHIAGTVLAVDFVQSLVATGWTRSNLLETYPYLTAADVDAALAYKA